MSIVSGGIEDNTFLLLDSDTLSADAGQSIGRGYDLVLDCNQNGLLDGGEIADGLSDRAGIYLTHDITASGPLAVSTFDDLGPEPPHCSGGGNDDMRVYYPADLDDLLFEGTFPLVVISHGNGHCYDWYDFLGNHLASYGYIVMSHDNDTQPGIETASTTTLEFTDKIPGYAAVNESVELAKRSGGAGWARLVNGVLRNYLRRGKVDPASISDPVEALAVQESHPEWLVRRWVARYGLEDTRRLCQYNNRRPHVTLRVNRRKTTVAELRAALQEAGIETEPSTYFEDFLKVRNAQGLTDTRAFKDGWFAIQDESTALPVRLLAPEEGETVLDLCAAPGGKSAYLAELQGDRGRVLAVDLSARRLSRVQENVRRLGLRSVQPLVADGTQLQVRPVDKILLDAPCSGLGVLAKRADLRWKRRPEDLARAAERQRALVAHAAQLLRPGGVLVYSTCTIEPEENEQVVEEFLRTHPDFAVDAWAPEGVDSALRDGPYWRTLPHVHGTDGTFAVRLEKS